MTTTETVDELYSSAAREKVLERDGNRFVSMTSFRRVLLDITPLKVCGVLKKAEAVIDAALEFDGRHAESLVLEIEANPERAAANPYCTENQESLKSIVRTVLASAADSLAPSMPPGWKGSPVHVSQSGRAEAALIGRIDEEYPRLRVDFESRAEARRRASAKSPPLDSAPTHLSPKQRTKRGQKDPGTNRGKAATLVATLSKHHGYDDGFCSNLDPIGSNELARRAEVGTTTAHEFFRKHFKGYDTYKAFCGVPKALGRALMALNGELRPRELHIILQEQHSTVPVFRSKTGTPGDDDD